MNFNQEFIYQMKIQKVELLHLLVVGEELRLTVKVQLFLKKQVSIF